jgi:hypothetical protein
VLKAGGVAAPATKIAAGPVTEDEAAGIARYGGLTGYAATHRKHAAS